MAGSFLDTTDPVDSRTASESSPARILVVDDEEGMREFLGILLQKEGYRVQTAQSGQEALVRLGKERFDLVITDLKMPKMSGIELLNRIKEKDPDVGVVLITAYASTETAVDAMKGGAFDYIAKPFDVEEMKEVVRGALKKRLKEGAGRQRAGVLKERSRFGEILGLSPAMQRIFELIPRVAPTPTNVLITGESGTGKELVALAIHDHSQRKDGPIVTINCGGIPENLLESELFGYQKGAFTGATANKPGLLELADKGTVFLDEVGELPPHLQVKLLRVVQERSFQRIGGTEPIHVDVRFICATNKNLEEEVIRGRFREDLYYRINVVHIHVPPLRERKEDIPLLAEHFLEKYAQEMGKHVEGLSTYALEVLKNYHFPGNVRELENIIQRGVALEQTKLILPESLKLASFKKKGGEVEQAWEKPKEEMLGNGFNLEDWLQEQEREFILKALERAGGVKTEAAKLLGISFRSFRYRLEKLGMENEKAAF
jgi:two-component system response regulator PilR (NtrC family)